MKMKSPATWSLQAISLIVWISFCLKITYDSIVSMNKTSEDKFFYEVYLYYNPILLMSTMVWLWGTNVWIFLTLHLPYAKVFELDSNYITHKDIWKIASWMTMALITSITTYFFLYSRGMIILAASQPVILYLMVPLILGLPLNVFYMRTRFFFLKTLVRLAFPIQPVLFADFFIGDILTSMAKVLSDVERSMCRMFHLQVATVASLDANNICGSHSLYVPIVSAFPFFSRLLQCLRQYHDTKDKTCLLNALKYTTSFPVIFIAALKYHVGLPFWFSLLRPIWVFFAILNSCYSFWWDITKDWDLGVATQFKAIPPRFLRIVEIDYRWMSGPWKPMKESLRPILLYNRPLVYYWAICTNLILRGAWTYKLSAPIRKNFKNVFIFSFLEMLRRFQWIFFRVEVAALKISSTGVPTSFIQVLSLLLGCTAGALALYLWTLPFDVWAWTHWIVQKWPRD